MPPPKPGAKSDPEEVLVAPGAAGLFKQAVDVRQESRNGFAIDEQIAVIVDEGGNAELVFEHWPQSHAATEARQIPQIADDASGVIRRTREGKADGCWRLGALLLNAGEALHNVGQATLEVVAVRRHGDGLGHRFRAAHGAETEVGAAGIEGHYDAFVGGGAHR